MKSPEKDKGQTQHEIELDLYLSYTIRIIYILLYFDILLKKHHLFYLMIPSSTKIFFNITTAFSTCSLVCVAISANRTNVS